MLNPNTENSTLDIFNLKHVQHSKDREETDFIARRKKCNNFEKYKEIFEECHKDLKTKERTIRNWKVDKVMQIGDFYIHRGLLAYIAGRGEIKLDKWGKWDGRLKIIFENGTESNMLMRSFGKLLSIDGKTITKKQSELLDGLTNDINKPVITDTDEEVGYIYILKSLSENEDIKNIENLYKIGYSKGKVPDRIKEAENDPTYLMAPVKIIQTYKCYNLNPQKLENILHKFFDSTRLKLDIFDKEGNRHTPREWFKVPLRVIDDVIPKIQDGTILNYIYNPKLEIIEEK